MTLWNEFTIGHLFSGSGGGALGAANARVAIGDSGAYFRTLGGVDVDEFCCKDFEYMVDAPATVADLHLMQPAELRKAWGPTPPDMVLLSPPCKGFSALLSKKLSKTEKYQKLNRLVLEGIFLLCSTWDHPPALIFLENVPRITFRGKDLLDQARQLLTAHGYRVTGDDYHDCGEIGGLAQHRRRFFLVARCQKRVPSFVYQPGRLRVKACGEVLAPLPTPGDEEAGGPLHRLPRISWLNWVRLSLIPAGGDWRDLPGVIPEGKTRRQQFRRHAVASWDKPVRTVTGPGGASADNIADPRIGIPDKVNRFLNQYNVLDWGQPAKTVTGATRPGSGAPAVADPRLLKAIALGHTADNAGSFKGRPGLFGVNDWRDPIPTVTGSASISGSNAVAAIADPRLLDVDGKSWYRDVLGVKGWDQPSGTVTGSAAPTRGAFSVADPRLTCSPRAGAYGVLSWEQAAATITGSMRIDNGHAAIADPRIPQLMPIKGIPENPKKAPGFIPVIIAADNTWHRPLSTLELASLQGFPTMVRGLPMALSGTSTTSWRERIGNAIPPPAAQAIASEMLLALLAARIQFELYRDTDIWVKDVEDLPPLNAELRL